MYAELVCNELEGRIKNLSITKLKKSVELIEAMRHEFIYGSEIALKILEQEVADMDESKDSYKIQTYRAEMKNIKSRKNPVPGAIALGYTEEYAIATYNAIEKFSGYGFNRSHSAAYSLLSYYTAYMKTHYPVEFMAALMTVDAASQEDTLRNIKECRRLGIEILSPDINRSKREYSIEFVNELDEKGVPTGKHKKAIRFGFESIKGIGEKVMEDIEMTKSNMKDDFSSMEEFFNLVNKRVINKGSFSVLILSGCFDFENENRHQLMNYYFKELRKDKEFDGTPEEYKVFKNKAKYYLPYDEDDFDIESMAKYEHDYYGFYLNHNPYGYLPNKPMEELVEGEVLDVGGKIINLKVIKTKNGDKMCFIDVDTASGVMPVTVFPAQYKKNEYDFQKDRIVVFNVKRETGQNGKTSLIYRQTLPTPVKKKIKKLVSDKEKVSLVAMFSK